MVGEGGGEGRESGDGRGRYFSVAFIFIFCCRGPMGPQAGGRGPLRDSPSVGQSSP